MKKKVLVGIVGSMLISSIGFAAPATDLKEGQTVAGYNYSNMNINLAGYDVGNAGYNGLYIQNAVSNKVTIGLEYNKGTKTLTGNGHTAKIDTKNTDFYGQYNLDKNFSIVAGLRKYDLAASLDGTGIAGSENKFLYGLTAKTELAEKVTGYATYLKTTEEKQWNVGATYQMSKDYSLDINYANHKYDDLTIKGLGFGVGVKF